MKKKNVLKLSENALRDIELIAKYKGLKSSKLMKTLEHNFDTFIQEKRYRMGNLLETQWILNMITDSEFKSLTGEDIPIPLIREKILHNTEKYKENARKALLMNFI